MRRVNRKRRQRKTKRNASRNDNLDNVARGYAKLIADPCYGRIVAPTMPGGTGNLVRLKKVYSSSDIISGFTGTVTDALWAFTFCPYLAHSGHKLVQDSGVLLNAAAGATASTGQQVSTTASTADFGFLIDCAAFRPIAGCVTFNNYANYVNIGGKIGSLYPASYGSAHSLDGHAETYNSRTAAITYDRTKFKHEQVWRPELSGWTSNEVASMIAPQAEPNNNIFFAGSLAGGTAATDFEIVVDFVYEYQPNMDAGISPGLTSAPSSATLERVVAAIPPQVFEFASKTASAAGTMLVNRLLGPTNRLTIAN